MLQARHHWTPRQSHCAFAKVVIFKCRAAVEEAPPPAMPHNLTLPYRALGGSRATLTGCPWSLRRVSYLPGAEKYADAN